MEEESKKLRQLIEKYPRLFHGRPPRIHSQVPPGWEGLIDDLCRDVDAELSDEEADGFRVLQIKEKFGALRFYVDLQGRSKNAGGGGWIAVLCSVHAIARAGELGRQADLDG